MITGGSGSGNLGRPSKPDLGGKQTKATKIKSMSFPTVKHKAPTLAPVKIGMPTAKMQGPMRIKGGNYRVPKMIKER